MTARRTMRRTGTHQLNRPVAGLAALGLALTLAACGADDDANGESTTEGSADTSGEETDGTDELRAVTVGILPIAPVHAITLGIEEGIFEEHGIEVELEAGQGGGAALAAVLSGELDFAITNPVSALQATGEGMGIVVIGGFAQSSAEVPDGVAIVVPGDSDIQSAADLEGRSVGVNILQGQPDLTIREAVRVDGGDPMAVELVEIQFPDLIPQLEAGNIDAGMLVHPFLGQALGMGMRVISWNYLEAIPGGQPALITYTGQDTVDSDPELVADFRAALAETLELAQSDHDAVRALLPEAMGLPVEVTENIQLDAYGIDLNLEAIDTLAGFMVDYGLTDEAPELRLLED